jgi:H+-transporting ATPase
VSNATDVAKGSASAILLQDGLSGVVDMVEVGRQIHRRVAVWVINKVAKASQHAVFILVLFLILGRFPISALGVVMLLLLMDFVLVSLATDRQPAGAQPDTWNLAQLTRIGLVIGMLGAGQLMTLILVTNKHDLFTIEQSQTFAWECMYLWGMLSVFTAREKSYFWSSRPSTIMVSIVVIETILVWIVCAVGVPGFDGIGWGYSSMVIGLGAACFVFNDIIKTLYIRYFEKGY